jgi:hypothetical protein
MERTASGIALETTAVILLITVACDAFGLYSLSFLLLVLGVPLAAAAGLAALARVIDEDRGRVQVALAAALLAVAVRSPAIAAPGVPPAATVALAAAFLVLLLHGLVALVERPARS